MSCQFCEKRMDYLLSKHAHFCLFCGDALHPGATPTYDRLDGFGGARPASERKVSKVYMNALVDPQGRRVCPECGAVVTRSDPRAVYCSLECQSRYNGRRQRAKKRKRA